MSMNCSLQVSDADTGGLKLGVKRLTPGSELRQCAPFDLDIKQRDLARLIGHRPFCF
jgi:hypothetical protein